MTAGDLKAQAQALVDDEMSRLRGLSYAALRAYLDKPVHAEVRSSSGTALDRETQVFWDGGNRGPLRVMVSAWGPSGRRWRSVKHLAVGDFIRAPDGTFVGEGRRTDGGR